MTRQAEDKSLEPEAVAAAVVEALISETPKTRSVLVWWSEGLRRQG